MSRNSQSSVGTSKNYVFKKQEAERIDFENRKLMARIIGSAGTVKSRVNLEGRSKAQKIKQIHNANTSILWIYAIDADKKMTEFCVGSIAAIETILQNKKRMMETVNSSYLPHIETKTMPIITQN